MTTTDTQTAQPVPGSVLLDRWLAERGAGSATALAFKCKISSTSISAWRHGARRPSYRHRLAIARATADAVPAASWAVTL